MTEPKGTELMCSQCGAEWVVGQDGRGIYCDTCENQNEGYDKVVGIEKNLPIVSEDFI